MEETEKIKGFYFMRQYYDALKRVKNTEDRNLLLNTIIEYAFTGKEPDESVSEIVGIAFDLMRTTIDGSVRKSIAQVENGKKGGAPEGNQNARKKESSEINPKQPKLTENKIKERKGKKRKGKNNEIEIINSSDKSDDKSIKNHYSSDFESFYSAYPRHINKQDAYKAFCKAIKNVSLETLLQAIEEQKLSAQWTKQYGEFIPYPATWLNKGGWENETDLQVDRNCPVDKLPNVKSPGKYDDYDDDAFSSTYTPEELEQKMAEYEADLAAGLID